MTNMAKTEREFEALWNEYTSKYNAMIYDSTENYVSILYGKFGQYDVTIVRPR